KYLFHCALLRTCSSEFADARGARPAVCYGMTLAQSPGNCLLSVAEVDESISSAIYGIRASWTKDQQFTRFIYRPDFPFGSWPCKNAVAAAFLEKPGLFVAVLIAAISGWIPIIFMTRVRL